jgi:hypothetical protein
MDDALGLFGQLVIWLLLIGPPAHEQTTRNKLMHPSFFLQFPVHCLRPAEA